MAMHFFCAIFAGYALQAQGEVPALQAQGEVPNGWYKIFNQGEVPALQAQGEVPTGWYKIFNQEFKAPLFTWDGVDKDGDHGMWIEHRPDYENGGKERFFVQLQPDGWYKIFNKKWEGPLIPGSWADHAGDHYAWVRPLPDYEGGGNERWSIENQTDGTYKLFNKRWKGPLFAGVRPNNEGNHRTYVATRAQSLGDRERWVLEPIDSHAFALAASSTSSENFFRIVCAAVLGSLVAGMIALVAMKWRVREGRSQVPLLSLVC